MKKFYFFVTLLLYPFIHLYSATTIDSLFHVLDKTIHERAMFVERKESHIRELKQKKSETENLHQLYQLNRSIISQYSTFVCDSAEAYINQNIEIAQGLNNNEYVWESSLDLAMVYSLSGLFVQASEVFNSIPYDLLPGHLKMGYCWTFIRYYENLMNYTDDVKFTDGYRVKKEYYRDMLLELLNDNSTEYIKETAFKLQDAGRYDEAIGILEPLFQNQQPQTHGYAMEAMSLAKIYGLAGYEEKEEFYLLLAAITDVQLAVKENEALLSLAINLYKDGDTNRAYTYIKVALDDANFYNSRFKNSMIARVQPIIESSYLQKIEQQKKNLRLLALLLSLFLVALGLALYIHYRQKKTIWKTKENLRVMNEELTRLNQRLDEANLVKEKYVGFFMNQCGVYINQLDNYRKNVIRKIKTRQIDDLYASSKRALEKQDEELYINFDNAFLELYPDFVKEFNSLLKPGEQYKLEKNQLNTELRIFALIRLGITDVNQIAILLGYSMQTIYNYKSKVKRKSFVESDLFEEEVKKLASLS